MSGFIKCNMEINFGDHEQFNTKSKVKVNNVDMDCTEFEAILKKRKLAVHKAAHR